MRFSATKAPKSQRRNWLQYRLSRTHWWTLVSWVIAIWFVGVVVFALIYGRHLTPSGGSFKRISFGDQVYFSGITQTTVGYGDYTVTGWARVATVIQATFGILWYSLTTALVVTRLLLPDPRGIEFGTVLGFNPVRHRFEALIITRNKGGTSRLRASLHRAHAPSTPLAISPSSVPYLMREDERALLLTEAVPLRRLASGRFIPEPSISPQPGEIGEGSEVVLEIAYLTPLGAEVISTRRYAHSEVPCGVHSSKTSEFVRIENSLALTAYCRHRCPFAQDCKLANKVP